MGVSLGLAACLILLGKLPASEPPAVKPVATVSQIMQAMVIPASNHLFDLPRNVPEDEPGWAAARNSAVILAESGNLLLLGDRDAGTDVWRATSRALVEAGGAAMQAALAKDAEAISEIGNQIIEACESCHEKHWIR